MVLEYGRFLRDRPLELSCTFEHLRKPSYVSDLRIIGVRRREMYV